jgi:hypothetical protein
MIAGYLPLGNFDFDLMSCTDRFSDSLLGMIISIQAYEIHLYHC